jgi:hypothetical protein
MMIRCGISGGSIFLINLMQSSFDFSESTSPSTVTVLPPVKFHDACRISLWVAIYHEISLPERFRLIIPPVLMQYRSHLLLECSMVRSLEHFLAAKCSET